jgi:hypothetical protein
MKYVWVALACYFVAFLAATGAYAEGPTRGFLVDWMLGGTVMVVTADIALAVAS